jgi:hypothetical protein
LVAKYQTIAALIKKRIRNVTIKANTAFGIPILQKHAVNSYLELRLNYTG